VRALDPAIRTGADTEDVRSGLDGVGARRIFHALQVPEVFAGTRVVTPEFIAKAHDAGVTVVVWTVNQMDDMRRLLDWGVDGLITDRPDIAVPLVRDWFVGRQVQTK
jgi:glycerophosphoryl diester phosphodiesterase